MELIIQTMHGLEEELGKELRALGAADIRLLKRAVSCVGDKEILYRANLELRTALRVLVQHSTFIARHEESLYQQAKRIDWGQWLNNNRTFAIKSTMHSKRFNHSVFIAQRLKDGLVDGFRDRTGKRPSVDKEKPDTLINLHCSDDRFSISFDSTGDPLYKRGYRAQGHPAPMNEVLAAGMLMLSGWKAQQGLVDPMCGSGTLAIEAAMIATNTPPAMHREHFAFMKWSDFDMDLWEKIKKKAINKIVPSEVRIDASDLSSRFVSMAQRSASIMGVDGCTSFKEQNFFDTKNSGVHVVINPPYGERIGKMDMGQFYKKMGDQLKQNYPNCKASIITSDLSAFKKFGLRPSKKSILFNGPLECRMSTFELYEGSKKTSQIR